MHWFLHTANVIYCFCYVVRDVLLLRILAVVAMLTLMVYYAFPPGGETAGNAEPQSTANADPGGVTMPTFAGNLKVEEPTGGKPMWVAIYWNIVFIGINLYWIVVILLERRPPRMTPEQRKLYEYSFHHSCSPRDMLRLLAVADWRETSDGGHLVSRGAKSDELIVIHSGKTSVQVNGTEMGNLRDGDLVGDMAYLTGKRTVADVIAEGKVRYIVWKKEALERLFEQRVELKSAIQGVIGQNLVERLSGSFPAVPELSMNVPSHE